jgi:small subunit ribosomal protein S13
MNQIVFLDKNIDTNKKLHQTLTSVKGLGPYRSNFICEKLGFQKSARFKDLDTHSIDLLKSYVEQHFVINNHLDLEIAKKINLLVDSGTYRGKRYKLGYPVRGQRTKTNSKSQRYLARRRFKNVFHEGNSNIIIKDKSLNSEVNKKSRFSYSKKRFFARKKNRRRF